MMKKILFTFILIGSVYSSPDDPNLERLAMTTVDCSSGLRIRERPTRNSRRVGGIPCYGNPVVERLGTAENGSWIHVRYDGIEGYAFARYLEVIPEVVNVVEEVEDLNEGLATNPPQEECNPEDAVPANQPLMSSMDFGQTPYYPYDPVYENIDVHPRLFHNFRELGGDETSIRQALCFLNNHTETDFASCDNRDSYMCQRAGYEGGIRLGNQRYVTINDLNRRGDEPRLYVLDLETGEVELYFSAHGSGNHGVTGNRNTDTDGVAEYLSNEHDSNLTPHGFFATGNRYNARRRSWQVGMRLHGLQMGINENSYERGIVMHRASYVQSGRYTNRDELSAAPSQEEAEANLTWGCTGLGIEHWDHIMSRIENGHEATHPIEVEDEMGNMVPRYGRNSSLYYNYSAFERDLGDNYCGEHPEHPLLLEDI